MGDILEFITLDERKHSRAYNFFHIDESTGAVIHRQLENRKGKIFMRAKKRFLGP